MNRASIVALALALAACGGSWSGDPAAADLSADLAAQRELGRLRTAWESSDRARRAALADDLERLRAAHPGDPAARVASGMLALVELERGNLDRARKLATSVAQGAPGATRDIAWVVSGALIRRGGDPARALAFLERLFGKVVDVPTRVVLHEELVLAATEAGAWDRAALYLRTWTRDAPRDDREATVARARVLLRRFPPEPVLEQLRSERAAREPDPVLSRLFADHLADTVLQTEDPTLARALLDVAGALLESRADAIARIAARAASVRLERNTVGLLVPDRSGELVRRGVEVAAGLGAALDLPAGRARLVTRGDGGSLAGVDDGLALLNADGAAVIVAGFDRAEADRAAAYAVRTGVPVLLLRAPSRVPDAGHPVFVIGEDPRETRTALLDALTAAGVAKVALLADDRGGETLPNAAAFVAVQPCDVPPGALRATGARAVLVDGGPACGRDARAGALGLLVAHGLDAGASGESVRATAGFVGATAPPGRDAGLDAWRAAGRGEPTWWGALGHDAGALTRTVVEAIPDAGAADDAAAQAARKARVAADLSRAEATLWTTDARGFAGARVLPRVIRVLGSR